MQHEEERMDESIVDITTTNTTGGGDVGECCRQFVYDYFFNTPENPFERGPYTNSDGNREMFEPQEMYDFWTASQETCDHFIEAIRQETSGTDNPDDMGYGRTKRYRRKILADYDSCVASNNIDSSGTFYRAWKSILKGGVLRLHFPSFKKAVLEWNETQQIGNEDTLENMLKEIQPIYEELYYSAILLDEAAKFVAQSPSWRKRPRRLEPRTEDYWREDYRGAHAQSNVKRKVTTNANKKIPTAKGTLSNILRNNNWIKKMKHNTRTIEENRPTSTSYNTNSSRYFPIGTKTESIGIYEKVK